MYDDLKSISHPQRPRDRGTKYLYTFRFTIAEGGVGTHIPVRNLARFKAPQKKNERYMYPSGA